MPDAPIQAPFNAYTGREPYIFVSYAHKDAEFVFPELLLLRDRGYRIWYDEGIDPGLEWTEEIGKALLSSKFFIVYITPNSVGSVNVRREINFAIRHKKPFIPVHLLETQLPPGLELQMESVQAILKYRTSIGNYEKLLQRALPKDLIILTGEPLQSLDPGLLSPLDVELKEPAEGTNAQPDDPIDPPPVGDSIESTEVTSAHPISPTDPPIDAKSSELAGVAMSQPEATTEQPPVDESKVLTHGPTLRSKPLAEPLQPEESRAIKLGGAIMLIVLSAAAIAASLAAGHLCKMALAWHDPPQPFRFLVAFFSLWIGCGELMFRYVVPAIVFISLILSPFTNRMALKEQKRATAVKSEADVLETKR